MVIFHITDVIIALIGSACHKGGIRHRNLEQVLVLAENVGVLYSRDPALSVRLCAYGANVSAYIQRIIIHSLCNPDSGVADALSTACFNLSLEAGQALIASLENTEAMWVLADGTDVYSEGFLSYLYKE